MRAILLVAPGVCYVLQEPLVLCGARKIFALRSFSRNLSQCPENTNQLPVAL